jgi:hypothetical protein
MARTPEERAAEALSGLGAALQSLPPEAGEDLQRRIAEAISEAVRQERAGPSDTLRLCVAAFNEVLALQEIPGHLWAAVRMCRGLCLDALAGNADPEPG